MSKTKNRGGRPRVDATPITVRVPPRLLAALDAMIAEAPPPSPTRPEAIRQLVEDGLTAMGKLPHRNDPEMAN